MVVGQLMQYVISFSGCCLDHKMIFTCKVCGICKFRPNHFLLSSSTTLFFDSCMFWSSKHCFVQGSYLTALNQFKQNQLTIMHSHKWLTYKYSRYSSNTRGCLARYILIQCQKQNSNQYHCKSGTPEFCSWYYFRNELIFNTVMTLTLIGTYQSWGSCSLYPDNIFTNWVIFIEIGRV